MTARTPSPPAAEAAGAALAAEAAEDRDFYRWYGSWASLNPGEIAARLAGAPFTWWIVGGWAVDTFTGVAREHEDVDVAFFRTDLPAVLEHLSPELCVWSNLSGTLRPLRAAGDLLEGARQLWVRRDGDSPWLMDLAMTRHDGQTWISPRDERVQMPLEDATFVAADAIRYLRPELVLFTKARMARSKDDRDLVSILPSLDANARGRLRGWIELVHPGHRWLARLSRGSSSQG
jgi:Aminoglycoside-2''-adenylyltransferase